MDSLVKKDREDQTNHKRRTTKSCLHTAKEEQTGVETKGRSSEVHHHTSKNEQDGVETKEGATIYFSGIGRSFNK